MLCLVQSFQKETDDKDNPPKGRSRLPWKRKKTPPSPEQQDDNFLHPDTERKAPKTYNDRQGIRHLSGSAPSVACTSIESLLTPSTCLSRQKKFIRHFKIHPDEKVIDYYSCALVADILLQGHLYISKNYFAFYSNVFGYVTKLIIPVATVINVTKEKTAFILPNAVGVTTSDNRHVFSSLLSRDTTYKLMVQVWQASLVTNIPDIITLPDTEVDVSPPCDESSLSGSESVSDSKPPLPATNEMPNILETKKQSSLLMKTDLNKPKLPKLLGLSFPTLLLVICTTLLVGLFLSASVLMYRVAQLQQSPSLQQHRSRSLYEVQEFLDTNLNHLYKVRQSLDVLSLIMENEKEKVALRKAEIQKQNLKETNKIPRADQLLEKEPTREDDKTS